MSSSRSHYGGAKGAVSKNRATKREASPGVETDLQASPTKKHRNLARVVPNDAPAVGFSPSATPGQVSRRLSFGSSDDDKHQKTTYALGTPGVSSYGRTIKPSQKAADMMPVKREPVPDNEIIRNLNSLFEDSTTIVTPQRKKVKAQEQSRLKSPVDLSDDDLPANPFEGYVPKSHQAHEPLKTVRRTIGSPIVISDSDDDTPGETQDGSRQAESGHYRDDFPVDIASPSDPYDDEAPLLEPAYANPMAPAELYEDVDDDALKDRINALLDIQAMRSAQRARSSTVSTENQLRSPNKKYGPPGLSTVSLDSLPVLRAKRPQPSASEAAASKHVARDKGKQRADAQDAILPPRHQSEEWESITNAPDSADGLAEIDEPAEDVPATPKVDHTICELLTTSGETPGPGRFLDMDIVQKYAPEAYGPALACMRFVQVRPFVNLVKHGFSAAEFSVSTGRLLFKSNNKNVVGIIVGGLTHTNIVDPHVITNRQTGQSSSFKRVVIAPTEDYMYALKQFIRSAYGEATLRTYMSSNADLSFSTMKEGISASGAKKDSTFYPDKHANPKLWYSKDFPACLEFDDTVKIYDARQHEFLFDEAAFRRLKDYPLFSPNAALRNKTRELPTNSIIAVAFTMSRWAAKTGTKNLALNVLFGILLGQLDHAHA